MSGRRHVVAVACLAALAAPAGARADATVTITPLGVVPSDVTVRAGEAVHWTNTHFLTQTVTSPDGLFESGPIPAGGGFTMALHVPGEHAYASAANPLLTGSVRVIARGLGGAANDVARDRIPELRFPAPDASEIGTHPRFGTVASATRILLRPTGDASVAEVNAALTAVDAEIAGGLPSLGTLLIVVPEQDGELGRFTGLAAALDTLRASGAFESASMSIQVARHAVPRRAEPAVEGVVDVWSWEPSGMANWGLKDARFPEAWNLRESIARRNPSVVTGILDAGFDQHPDLTPQLHVVPQLCPGSGPCIPLPNDGDTSSRAHGTHVAGIVNASWDNPLDGEPPRSPRSKGVSGGNPFAKLEGVTIEGVPPTGNVSSFILFDTVVSRFDALLRDRPEGLRVINYSAGARAFDDAKAWTTAFPNPSCGPGSTDDSLPEVVTGTKNFCTQQNQDDWLREWAHVGMHARAVAELAAEANVLIVQSAGNDSDVFCLPWGEKSCPEHPETRRIIHAENSVEFGWATKHWQTGPNPILIAEASRSDGFRAIYSNIAGDLSAPGTGVWSTVTAGTYGQNSGTSMAAPHITAAVGYLLAFDPDLTPEEVKDRLVQWSRPPPANPVPPANVFEWDTAPRYGLDEDADGVIDAHLAQPELRPATFPVDFDACGFSLAGDPITSYAWTVEGQLHITGSCRFRHYFDDEGTYHVSVTFRDADGETSTAGRDVVVEDLVLAAIGDGVAAGESAPDKPDTWQDSRCHRSGRGAAAQTARWLESAHVASTVTFLNLACLGSRIRGDGPGDGGLLTPYAGFEPDDPPLSPQLDRLGEELGTRELDALLVSAGAGDLGLAAIAASCIDPATDCSTGEGKTIFEERLPVLPLRYGELAARIQQLGVDAERVLVPEYGDFTRDGEGRTDLTCITGVSGTEAAWLGDTVLEGLNEALRTAAQLHGWTIVGADALERHGLCAAEPWFGETLHPNEKGHAALAERFVGAFRGLHGAAEVDPRRAHGDAAPRLDIFASLLASEGAARRLVDVNDATRDGNRRVVRTRAGDGSVVEGPDETVTPTGPKTAPDGYVDLRDLRRFRDAWLASCLTADADDSCPDPASIVLDGPADHPKRDLNGDGCVHRDGDPGGCGATEQDFSRFDFNGDRHVSVERKALVPLDATGEPVEMRDEGTKMSDLDVLRSRWDPSPALADGWTAADADALLRSGDVEIHADGLLEAGASSVQVEVRRPGGALVGAPRTIRRQPGFVVVTVPVQSIHDDYVVHARAETASGTFTGRSATFTLRYGEDVRVDVGRALALRTSDDRLPADGEATTTVTASVTGAGAGLPVAWTLTPASGGAVLQEQDAQTDPAGKAEAVLRAGTEAATYTLRAEIQLGAGESAEAELEISVQPLVTIRYAWRQEIVEWVETGSTRWTGFPDLNGPDCTDAVGVGYCIDESRVELNEEESPALLRRGTIKGGADTFTVTDEPSSELTLDGLPVVPGYGQSRITWTESEPDGSGEPETFEGGALWQIHSDDLDQYADHPVEGLVAEDEPDGIHLSGLHAVGDLPYRYSAIGLTTQEIAPELHGLRTDILLTPKEPELRIRFATGAKQQAVFPRTDTGFTPFQSCGRYLKDLTTEPGYLLEGDPDDSVLGTLSTVQRKTEYELGDRPMPVGEGRIDVRYAFAATVAYGDEEPPEPLLPDCGGFEGEPNAEPTADFAWEAAELAEGRMIHFVDRSTDLEDEIVEWKWEHNALEGATGLNGAFKPSSDEQHPWFIAPDDGPVTVKLTVTDKSGATSTVEKVVQLSNLEPEAYLADAAAEAGQPTELLYAVMDTSDQDKRALRVRIDSTNPDWPTLERTEAAGIRGVIVVLPAGAYPLTLTVTDPDGASATAEALLVVTGEPPSPPEEEGGADTPTCLDGVALDAQEQAYVALVNEYRDANGVEPVEVSGTLSLAAALHAQDMAENGYFAHEGLNGSTPSTRAWAAGYPPEEEVGENLAKGYPTAFDVLLGWRSSLTGHNENQLTPNYAAIGVGRYQNHWATSYGNALDCQGADEGDGEGDDAPAGDGSEGSATEGRAVLSTLGGAAVEAGAAHAAAAAGEDATAAAPADYLPTTAFTVSAARPRVGGDVVFTNRSDLDAVLELPGIDVPLAPGEAATYAFTAQGAQVVRLRTTDGTAAVTRTFDVLPAPLLALTYTGPAIGAAGKPLTVSAQAGDPGIAGPVAGIELEFTLGGTTARATTNGSGIAVSTLDLAGIGPGLHRLDVRFAGDATYPAVETGADVTLFVNAPPTAHAGGPYTAGEGANVLLDGSRSTDVDAAFGDAVAFWRWDADGDGAFDDGEGMTVLVASAAICGGPCITGRDYPVALRVTDKRGESAVAAATVRFTADFAVALAGGAMTVVPGSSPSHYGVTVVGSASWTEPVTLSAVGLPTGVTASFSVNPVTAPGTSVLTLTASGGAQTGGATVTVQGTSNGLTRSTDANLSVAFGLVPQCFGTITGVVRDRDTGAPLADVHVQSLGVRTDANGRYTASQVHLGFNNSPTTYFLQAVRADYWPVNAQVIAACGLVAERNFDLRRKLPGRVTGVVVDQETGAPIAGALVHPPFSEGPSFTSVADGTFAGDVDLGLDNADRTHAYRAVRSGYWFEDKLFTVSAGATTAVQYTLVRQCHGRFAGGRVLDERTGAPVAGITVASEGIAQTVVTNAQGVYTFDRDLLLGTDNAPRAYQVFLPPQSGIPAGTTVPIVRAEFQTCGQVVNVDVPVRFPILNTAVVEGYALEEVTGEPIAGAAIVGPGALPLTNQSAVTDANGFYRFETVFVGFDAATSATFFFSGSHANHYTGTALATINANQVNRVDVQMLRQRLATLDASVKDAQTGAPIAGVSISSYGATNREGRLVRDDLTVGFRNGPLPTSATVFVEGYWPQTRSATLRAGETAVLDYRLVRVCAPARITGTVINALTQAPIAGANVSTGSRSALTNAQGVFELRNVSTGENNVPAPVFLTASATGFLPQTKLVTVYCGGSVVVDFGSSSTGTSTIVGTVTNLDTGQPVAGAFVGGEHGGTATTDAAGNYTLSNVPLGALDVDREWDVTAIVDGFKQKTVTVVARAGQTVRADFGFTKAGNDRPIADAQMFRIDEDRSTPQFALTGSDANGDGLTYHVVLPPAHGRLSGVPPNLQYSPNHNFHGSDELEFVAFDGQDYSEPARVSIQVDPVNDPPFLQFDEVTRPAGAPARIPVSLVLANDVDADGDELRVTAVSGIFGVTAILDGTDIVVSRTGAGDAFVDYNATDGTVTTSARLLVHFVPTPIAPVCGDASFAGIEGQVVSGLLACTDANGDALTYAVASPPAVGLLSLQPSGAFTYTPPIGFTGETTFRFTAGDGSLTSAAATATIRVAAANTAPVCGEATFATDEDVPLTATLGCADAEADVLGYTLVDVPAAGTLDLAGDGSFTYEPAPDADGTVAFVYRVSDGALESALATATIDVRAVNDAPVAADLARTTDEDTPLTVELEAEDVDEDALALSWTQPAHGSFDGTTYKPAPDFHGSDSFTYTADDGNGATATATVTLTVISVNDAPVAPDTSGTTDEDAPLAIDLPATDVDGDTLTLVHTSPAHGNFDGTTYTPAPNYHGSDSFTYTATDPAGASATGTVTITVNSVNDAPVVENVAAETDEDTPIPIALAGTDVDGDALALSWTQPAHGTFDGSTYTSAPNYHGPDSFTYAANDGHGGAATAAVTIDVRPVNDAPVAPDVAVETDEDTPLALALAGTDVDGDALTLTHGQPVHGTYDGTTYVPTRDFHGDDSLRYTVDDGHGGAATGTVSILVRSANDQPGVADREVDALEDTPLPLALTGTDADGEALSFTWTAPEHGTYDGTTYVPAPGFTGLDSFTFTADDGSGGRATATVRIQVRAVAKISVVLAGPAAVDEGGAPSQLEAIVAGVPDGGDISYAWTAASGSVTGSGASVAYANDDGPRTDTVTVTVESAGQRATASLEIAVRNVPPVASAGPDATVAWGLPLLLAGAATDPSGADHAGLALRWTFSDGSSAADGAGPTRTFASPGAVTAMLTATDKDGGSDSDELQIAVERRATSLALTRTGGTFGWATLAARLSDTTDAATAKLGGRTVVFEVEGVTYEAITDAEGEAVARPALPLPPGEHEVVARFAADSHYLASDTRGVLRIESSDGRVTGGGLRERGGDGRGGFNALASGGAMGGELQWQSGGAKLHAHEITAVGIASDRRSAWIAGTGRDGLAFVAYVEDNGEPGRDDVFRLWINGALRTTGDGRLDGGNVQIHDVQPGPAGDGFAV